MNHPTNKEFTGRMLLCSVLLIACFEASAERLKDIADISGVRDNQLFGYGLVVGLDGTGESLPFTQQSFRSMLSQYGVALPQGSSISVKNAAAVSITASLPAFSKPGQNIDITVSSIGSAKSLRGGTLLMSPLKGADGNVYAIAQGNLVVGGLGVEGSDGSKISINVPSVGRIPNGATVEREVPTAFMQGDHLTFNLHRPDFTTAKRVMDTITGVLGPSSARALDGSSIRVTAPRDPSQRVLFMSVLENLEVDPGEASARIVINSRTGTIVIGKHVRVKPAAVTHGSLTVTIREDQEVSQPGALSDGATAVVPESQITVEQENAKMFVFKPGVSLDEIVSAVNQGGAAPGDLMAILEALKQAGALRAELMVI